MPDTSPYDSNIFGRYMFYSLHVAHHLLLSCVVCKGTRQNYWCLDWCLEVQSWICYDPVCQQPRDLKWMNHTPCDVMCCALFAQFTCCFLGAALTPMDLHAPTTSLWRCLEVFTQASTQTTRAPSQPIGCSSSIICLQVCMQIYINVWMSVVCCYTLTGSAT